MKELYEAVWGQESRFIREFTVLVPRAEYGIRPGYRVTMRPSKMGAFAPSEFTSKRQMKSFKVMEVGAVLPCGTKRILIRPEYETICRRLIRAEKERRLGASRSSIKLDYQISGQPGIGMQSSALQFLNSGGSLEIGKHNPCLYRDLHGISRNNFWGFFTNICEYRQDVPFIVFASPTASETPTNNFPCRRPKLFFIQRRLPRTRN